MIWDVRNAAPALILKAHAKEVLWADWCKYNDCVLATASIDKTIKVLLLYMAFLCVCGSDADSPLSSYVMWCSSHQLSL